MHIIQAIEFDTCEMRRLKQAFREVREKRKYGDEKNF
jgi:hypothetical protein